MTPVLMLMWVPPRLAQQHPPLTSATCVKVAPLTSPPNMSAPRGRNGTESDTSKLVRGFSSILAEAGAVSRPPVSVLLWDERFTTAQAHAMIDRHGGNMGKRVEIDSLAASLILDHYFARRGNGAERVEPREGAAQAPVGAGVAEEPEEDTEEEDGGLSEFGSLASLQFEHRRGSSQDAGTASDEPLASSRARNRKRL